MAAVNSVTDLTLDGEVAVITLNSPPVNALSFNVRSGLYEALAQAVSDPASKAILLICEGRTFVAGADITELGGKRAGPLTPDIQARIEASPKPIVAAIHGAALGGGLELALAAHYRVAVPSAKLGLPEVKLGLLPGGGGTQRLPRVVGAQKALEMVAFGEPIPAQEALAIGLLDELAPEGGLRAAAIAFARRVVAENRPLRKVSANDDKVAADRGKPEIFENFRKANARKFRGFLAPGHNISAVEAAVNLPFEEGIKEEARLFEELISGPQSAAQRYAFFAEREAAKIPDIGDDIRPLPIRKVGVLGAGTMGGGIAMNFANAGIPVTLVEVKHEALDRGLGVIRANYERTAARGGLTAEQVAARTGLIAGSLSMEAFADADLVIEAVFENMDLKKEVFGKVDAVCKPGAILATNTSYLNVDEIAAVTKRPESVIGLHFFSPANVMRLLEIVRAEKTSKAVVATAVRLAKQIGKIGVVVGVSPGFVGNRMLAQRRAEAEALVMEGAMPWDVDRVLVDFGFPMGQFAMSDLAGLDIGWSRATSTGSTLREVLAEMGRLGQKTGGGFYDYDANRNATPSPVAEAAIREFVGRKGVQPREIGEAEMLERQILPMINEGAKILDEGKAIRPSDIDMIWVYGYGWPVYRGGPMHYADQLGLATVLEKLRAYQTRHGERFKPAALLERLVAENKRLADRKA